MLKNVRQLLINCKMVGLLYRFENTNSSLYIFYKKISPLSFKITYKVTYKNNRILEPIRFENRCPITSNDSVEPQGGAMMSKVM